MQLHDDLRLDSGQQRGEEAGLPGCVQKVGRYFSGRSLAAIQDCKGVCAEWVSEAGGLEGWKAR